ncbi:beta-glucosidase-like glycosyl hydrolase/CubicO group peptidase (beta-lactamase class C family) [Mesoflavibacter sabulilitoris]|uniref:beta-N-acetylhexosaminidase n=1 Tax=Mesoflavibacter zeaxanthinifaciens subsp. sabulilitoris TaxID=1520893 RepID=A0A2T1NGE3_9FLAO|nr:glycoside hydrolase family 3 N-terminal domain-containing protein [Mesoflavibacter zeaxanthinifaciens]MBB3122993.1 beta-glucosidase-like glycosyl hydrolase/CubicO group peptidase (beta-lactamase class C family) [Mesoflavibacter zeaxanthinifaciens subsp. sabulilitoris]PSG91937.1 beta-N-acetylglucosaminidase [Mesoflavibacter zeaxanthinifaciens subsp. sabulilitoris]
MHKLFFLAIFCLFSIFSISQNSDNPLLTKDKEAQKKWVDSVYNSLSLNEKIGQLYMVQVFSNGDGLSKDDVLKLIEDNKIGGIIYSKGGPVRQAQLNNQLQAASATPLLIGMDAEWGLSMRLDSTYSFPWNMTLGAVKNNELIEQTGRQLGEHCKRLGVHFNFAPVVDINTNPNNPIIGNRSFGEDRDDVTEKALAFMKGMQSAGVLANAKHFPGHGDTSSDSHKTLPTIDFSAKRIDSIELYPYKKLIKEGLSSVMVGHLNVPSLTGQEGLPSSISNIIIKDILKERLKFEGLIFTDALTMKGVSEYVSPSIDGNKVNKLDTAGEVDLAAFLAGNDVMLMSENVAAGINKIAVAYQTGKITEKRLAHSVKKILMAKYKVGLNNYKQISTKNLVEDLNRIKDDVLYEKLMENAITIAKDSTKQLPFRHLETKKIAYVKLGDDSGDVFYNELKKYTDVHIISDDNLYNLISKLQNYNTVIVGFHKSNDNPWKSYKFSDKELTWLYEIARNNNVVLNVFAKPYALMDLKTISNFESIIVSYQNSDIAQQKSAQLIFGAIPARGYLSVSAGPYFSVGDGVQTNSLDRLGYSTPERVGMSSAILKKVDSIANYAITNKMTPGIQLIVARHGKVIYNKNFGKHTYEGDEQVKFNDIYDVASLTKIVATLPLLMELEEKGVVSLDTKLSDIIPEYKKSNKKDVTLKRMLSHYAQLKPWIPFYYKTLDTLTKKPSLKYYRKEKTKGFTVKVMPDLYMRDDYKDSINGIIKDTDLLSRLRYRYSDLPYYILKQYIEKHYDKPLDELVQDHFYKSLGANYTTYNPSEKFSNKHIVPSENDDYYRFQTVQGYVHDMGAAMQGGVGGHAGIFSNANDIAKIMQLFLQKGFYGGKRYFKSETLDKFNTCYFCESDNRRGIGFDKPQLGDVGPTCGCVSMTSFGHSGFTGTYAWADPETEIVYVFMANRTYPTSMGKNMLLRENIRTNIQEVIYEAIIE